MSFGGVISTTTRRDLFHAGGLINLAIYFAVSVGYFVLYKRVTNAHRKSFVYYYLGMILVTAFFIVPFHIIGVRFIEIAPGVLASLPEQILLMYGWNLAVEAVVLFLPQYVLIYHFKLIELK
jgi:hypothetical protein